jgi:hypothetical protein
MGLTEDVEMLALIAAAPKLAAPDDTEAFLDAMPISELASMWGAVTLSLLADELKARLDALVGQNRW